MEMSLKDAIMNDIKELDEFFEKNAELGLAIQWGNVREAAISFVDIFEKVKTENENA